MRLSCLLQKIMRREYIKAQNLSTFKEQAALIKIPPARQGGSAEGRGACGTSLAITPTSGLHPWGPPTSLLWCLGIHIRCHEVSQLSLIVILEKGKENPSRACFPPPQTCSPAEGSCSALGQLACRA